jgi:hypothetical protein
MLAVALVTLTLAGCQKSPEQEPKMLGITGYNYTDRYIDGFSVNGQGGSNVLLSDDSDGGGKTACCIVWRPGTQLPVSMFVEWTYGYEKDFDTGQLLHEAETHRVEVELKGPVPEKPTIFAVHFYPDNTVQVEVAEDYPKPRLKRSDLTKGAQP